MLSDIKTRILLIFRNHSLPRWMVLLIDMSVVYFSFLIAYMLRFNFETYSFDLAVVFRQAWMVLSVYTLFMLIYKSYSGMIRHTTIRDTYKIILTGFSSMVVLIPLTLLSRQFSWNEVFNIPLSIVIIHSGAITILLFFFRVFVKIFYEFASSSPNVKKNVIIYGSGETGIVVRRVIEADRRQQYRVRCYIDDDKKLHGKKVNGYPVYSRNVLTKEFIAKENIQAFIIAINKLAPAKKKDVIESVIELGCEILDTPSFDTWLNGQFEIKHLQKVKFEDLLGRDPILLDLEKIQNGLKGKTILVTGAAGSIGSEIARQLMKFETGRLILFDQAETPCFFLGQELKTQATGINYKIVIGDITHSEIMEQVFMKYKPQIVFHAAAYKHVPLMELHPHEAFRVNVGGTKLLAELSIKYNVEKFVMISSDKAVNPTNVMGATKKLCEILVHTLSKRQDIRTHFVTTRFGNVLGSNGSVIPLFNRQIAEGGPVTITHPNITRFFMTIPEACQLVLEAGFMGNGGHIYVFDMGKPVKVLDVAINLIRLSGLEPYKDIKIKFVGLRPGEKLFEELFSTNEPMAPTHNPKINIACVPDMDFEVHYQKISDVLEKLYTLNSKQLITEMINIVPGYISKHELIDS
ncbi:MAG TPA: nucleoside-diphosphate sugar epimerase/dehydratase [Bacteroidales bacterium]|nr:nucleoside-diphosphate sugar epimerase/dehydratase [Bacteroidales bacterium]